MEQKKTTIINPELNLHQLPIFIITAFTGTLLAIILAYHIWPAFPPTINNYEVINKMAFEVLKVPCAIIAVTLSLLVIIGTVHRSAQTSKQIEISIQQNNTSLYYRHLDDFSAFVESNEHLKEAYDKNTLKRIHDKLWPGYFRSNYNVNLNTLEQFENHSNNIANIIIDNNLTEKELKRWNLYLSLLIKEYSFENLDLEQNDNENLEQLIGRTSLLFHLVLDLYSFEINIKRKSTLKKAYLIVIHNPFSDRDISYWLNKQLNISGTSIDMSTADDV